MTEENKKQEPRIPKEVMDKQRELREEQKKLIMDELELKVKIQDVKEANLHLIDGKVAYYTHPEYIDLVTKLERLHLNAYKLQAQEQLDKIDGEMSALEKWGGKDE